MTATTPLADVVQRSTRLLGLMTAIHPDLTHLSGGWTVGSKLEPHTS